MRTNFLWVLAAIGAANVATALPQLSPAFNTMEAPSSDLATAAKQLDKLQASAAKAVLDDLRAPRPRGCTRKCTEKNLIVRKNWYAHDTTTTGTTPYFQPVTLIGISISSHQRP